MRFSKDSKYFKLGITLFISGACLIFFHHFLKHFDGFTSVFSTVEGILSPFIYGFVMAYLLCPIYNFTVRNVYKHVGERINRRGKDVGFSFAKFVGIIVSLGILIGIFIGVMALLLPQLIDSIIGLVEDLPKRFAILQNWVNELTGHIKDPRISDFIETMTKRSQKAILDWAEHTMLPALVPYVNSISQGIIVTLKTMMNVVIGIMVSVYFLNGKELFLAQIKKMIIALTSEKKAKAIFEFGEYTNKSFGGFISGKLIDSLIIGILCFIAMKLMGLPYPVLISTIIGITNIIPFFGPFIGAIPCAIITALVNPVLAVYFLIMIFVLQQLDGNVIGPLVLGGTTGVNSFWIMFAIIFGGGLFGVLGMLLGVPVFAIIYHYVGRFIDGRLERKGLAIATKDYESYKQYEPRIKKKKEKQ